jgi:hypothetical protein
MLTTSELAPVVVGFGEGRKVADDPPVAVATCETATTGVLAFPVPRA